MKVVTCLFMIFAGLTGPGFNVVTMQKLNSMSMVSENTTVFSNDRLLSELLHQNEILRKTVEKKEELAIQVIYTEIKRGGGGKKIKFADHHFNVSNRYFYPASTVKLPVAILALQRINELNITGLDKNAVMLTGRDGDIQTEVTADLSAKDGKPSIGHYIKKILLVSENDAFNRLYEFLGPDYINRSLHEKGYQSAEIVHRLSISLTEDQNRHTNPVAFYDRTGKLLYKQPAKKNIETYPSKNITMGSGFMQGGNYIDRPFDFSKKNVLDLQDLHSIVHVIMFPGSVPASQRFNLTEEDYDFLRLYMSMRPGESESPVYQSPEYWDNYVKMIFYGTEKTSPPDHIRIFNKTGTAYGFLTESCYFVDFKNQVEFQLSATIYCNSDGVFNDDKYDYGTVGYPF